ncbi:MAG: RnfABCDGE type electron transport complex subunit D [Fervidobacterium sp.]
MSKPKEYSWMTKNKLMTYTFVALVMLAAVSAISWWSTSIIVSIVAVVVAVTLDYLLSLVMKNRGSLNTLSAAVFGLIVALSYSLGIPAMHSIEALPLQASDAYLYVGVISAVGMVLFKKLQGLSGRKYVNPAATAKLVVMLPFFNTLLLAKDHLTSGIGLPALAGPIGYTIIGENGLQSFATYMISCFGNPSVPVPATITSSDVFWVLMVQKFHGWIGGASSLAVIIVGIGLFAACRRYIKWRITTSYLVTVALLAFILSFVYGDADPLLRVVFHIFVGSSIFLAFFMATDPATTPLTYRGQLIFGIGLGVLTVLIQTYMNFFGGSILALIIMNLTSPLLDKVGLPKPTEAKRELKLPKTQQFETVKTTSCIRCGACIYVCPHNLSPILIKEAFDKGNMDALRKLQADLCDGCGHCSFVCPARIDLKGSSLRAKASLRTAK